MSNDPRMRRLADQPQKTPEQIAAENAFYNTQQCPCEDSEPEPMSEYDVPGQWINYTGEIDQSIFENAARKAENETASIIRNYAEKDLIQMEEEHARQNALYSDSSSDEHSPPPRVRHQQRARSVDEPEQVAPHSRTTDRSAPSAPPFGEIAGAAAFKKDADELHFGEFAGALPFGEVAGALPFGEFAGALHYGEDAGALHYGEVAGALPFGEVAGALPFGEFAGALPLGGVAGALPFKKDADAIPFEEVAGALPFRDVAGASASQNDAGESASKKDAGASAFRRVAGAIPFREVPGAIPVREVAGAIPVREVAGAIPVREVAGAIPVREVAGAIPFREDVDAIPFREDDDEPDFDEPAPFVRPQIDRRELYIANETAIEAKKESKEAFATAKVVRTIAEAAELSGDPRYTQYAENAIHHERYAMHAAQYAMVTQEHSALITEEYERIMTEEAPAAAPLNADVHAGWSTILDTQLSASQNRGESKTQLRWKGVSSLWVAVVTAGT